MLILVLRPATSQDRDFLWDLHVATMRECIARIWGWDEQWQRGYFYERFDATKRQIIVWEGQDVGVLAVERLADQVRVNTIEVLPAHQRQGIGSYLLSQIKAEAFARGVPVRLQTFKSNTARQFYAGLGFVETGETDTHVLLEARPR